MSDPLQARTERLTAQLKEYEGLLKSKFEGQTTVYLGDGYFASMSPENAHQFITRKLSLIKDELNTLNQLNGTNDEGLPVFDIVEELDEDGEILSSEVKRTGFHQQLMELQNGANKSEHSKSIEPSQSGSSSESTELVDSDQDKSRIAIKDSAPETRKDSKDVGKEPPSDVESDLAPQDIIEYESSEEKTGSQSQDDDSNSSEVEAVKTPSADTPEINPADILELDLESDSDSEPVNFDFNNLELEQYDFDSDSDSGLSDDDDDSQSDISHGWRAGGMFPHNEATMRALEAHFKPEPRITEIKDEVELLKEKKAEKSNAAEKGVKPNSVVEKDVDEKGTNEEKDDSDDVKDNLNSNEETPRKPAIKSKDSVQDSGSRKVHFADNVDVREFESNTTTSHRFFSSPPPSLSRFKRQRQAVSAHSPLSAGSQLHGSIGPSPTSSAGTGGLGAARAAAAALALAKPAASSPQSSPATKLGKPTVVSTAGAHANASPSSSPAKSVHLAKAQSPPVTSPTTTLPTSDNANKVHGAVVERDHTTVRPIHHIKPPGRARLSSQQRQEENQGSPKAASPGVGFLRKTSVPHHPRLLTKTNKSSPLSKPSLNKPTPDKPLATPQSMKDKVKEDADKYFEESFMPDDEFLKLHDNEKEQTEKTAKNSANQAKEKGSQVQESTSANNVNKPEFTSTKAESTTNKPILSGVQEKEPTDEPEDSGEEDPVNMTEIKQEYQRLRQNMIYESGGYKPKDSEKAIEQIDENGEPKKVSRFKAARIG